MLLDAVATGVKVRPFTLSGNDLAHERAREAEHTRIRTRLGDPDRVCQTVVVDGTGEISAPGVVVIVCRSFGRPW